MADKNDFRVITFRRPPVVKSDRAAKPVRQKKSPPDQVPCDPEVKELIRRYAERTDQTMKAVVAELVKAYSLRQKYQKLLEEELDQMKRSRGM